MRGRWIWLTLVGIVVLGLVIAFGVLGEESQALKPKRSVAPSLLAPSGVGGSAATVSRGSKAAAPTVTVGATITAVSMDRDLRDLPRVPATPLSLPELDNPLPPGPKQGASPIDRPAPPAQSPDMPATIQNFDGMTHDLNGAGWPPDTNGDVGQLFYIQSVNTSIGIYTKTGTSAIGYPVTFNSLWSGAGSGTPCDTTNQGDPTVVYDPMGGRFFVADFAWTDTTNGPYYECIAVSKTSNPVTGGWWLYAVRADDAAHPWLNDYPKMGVWPDGVYVSYNMFDCQSATCSPGPFKEVRVQAMSRTTMEAGGVITLLNADLNTTTYFSLAPSTMHNNVPPAGRENLLVSESGTLFAWEVWKFHADFVTPGLSTFTGPTNVSQTAYTVAPATITTPGNPLDTLRERVMVQNQYTKIGAAESLWVNHTVNTGAGGAPVGIQWAQINVTGGTVLAAPVQQQIYGNLGGDLLHRWMGSLAVDKSGNMSLGYSAANAGNNPSIRYNGRLAGDALNGLPQGEATMFSGTGSQGASSCSAGTCTRWGDYSGMTLDPDGCTFWYTTEYYDSASGGNWRTRVGSFSFAPNNCTNSPTAVSVSRFAASRTARGVTASWRTSSEVQVVGFNVWRQNSAGRWTKLNPTLIAAKHAGQARGSAYSLVDRSAFKRVPYNYRLQVVAPSGKRAWYGLSAV